ncbi:hypothetical protein ACHAXT_005118 [Thalassiosira profunda]
MADSGKDGLRECIRMQQIVDGLGSDTRILVASLRDADTIADLAAEGLDTYTFFAGRGEGIVRRAADG